MGSLLTQPITEKKSQQGEGLGLRYGLSSMQGWRLEMEDAHYVKIGLKYGLDDWSFFAVFDGHAGGCAARYASHNLLEYILRDSNVSLGKEIGPEPLDTENETVNRIEEHRKTAVNTKQQHETENSPNLSQSSSNEQNSTTASVLDKQMIKKETSSNVSDSLKKPSRESKNSQDQENDSDTVNQDENVPKSTLIQPPNIEPMKMVRAIRSGFLQIDQAMRMTDLEMSGCTAVCSLISPTQIFIANCGDSRAVLYDGTSPKFVTEDHKPFNPKERKRIIDAGGTATVRINGTLAVSRALGDFEFKKDEYLGQTEQLVSPEPEVTVIERHSEDEFLILACDGIWDVMNNEDLCQFVKYMLTIESDIEKICSSVLDVCLRKGSRDNMSIILVVFESGFRVNQKEIEQDQRNNVLLLEFADSLQEKLSELGFNDFLMNLKTELDLQEDIVLPPGAGIEAKYDLLRKRFLKNKNISEEKVEGAAEE